MRRGSSSPRFANTAEEIQASFERFYDQSLAQPTDPNVLYTMEHDLMSAGVLDVDEMTAAATALLSDDPALQPQIYANLEPAVMRFVALDDDAQTELRAKLTQYCRAYAFVSQVMPWTDADLERMFLYGKLLLAELPASDSDPIPQLSRSVQLTHLRLSVTGEGSIELGDDTEPGVALPGEGKGSANEPEKDKLSALIEMMNEKYGADLGEPDKVWIDQQRAMILDDEEMAAVALNNDRSQFELILDERIKELIVDRHSKNGVLFDLFFSNDDFRRALLSHLGSTYDEFRRAG